MNFIGSIPNTLAQMPSRAWCYGQRCPYEAIVYGLVLIALAMVSKLAIAAIAAITITSGLRAALKS